MTEELSAYEKLRADLHEETCRMAATLVAISSRVCQFRQCRRRGVCIGPMIPSPHQARTVGLQRSLGLSGKACAMLPGCVANQDPRCVDLFKATCRQVQVVARDRPGLNLWPAVIRFSRQRRSRALTSNPDHPTSLSDKKD